MDIKIKQKIRVLTYQDQLQPYRGLFALGLKFQKGAKGQEYFALGLVLGSTIYTLEIQWNRYWDS